MKYCSHCGSEIMDEAVVCPKCGCATTHHTTVRNESNGKAVFALVSGIVAVALSFIGYFALGFLEIIAFVFAILATVYGSKTKLTNGNGKAGFVLGIIGTVMSSIGLVVFLILIAIYGGLMVAML